MKHVTLKDAHCLSNTNTLIGNKYNKTEAKVFLKFQTDSTKTFRGEVA